MILHRGFDGNGSPYIAWKQSAGFKRAWIQKRAGEQDWAGTGIYLNVVRTKSLEGGPQGNATDFPIYNDKISPEQILEAFVAAVCAITGCSLS